MRYEIFRMCRRMRPALVHTRNQSGLDALLPARLAGVSRSIHGEHGWDVDNLSGRKWKPALLRRIHSPLVCRYVVVSQDLKEFLVNRIGIDPSRIVQIYNGVDTNRFSPATAKPIGVLPPELRSDGLVRIGTVGRLQAVKDQQTLLRAFAQLLSSDPAMRDRVRLLIVGDGPLLHPLRMLAESLGIAAFTWFSGAVENVPDLLATFDVFVLPSLNEGVSNTLLEAMACGIPIAATAVGGSKEIVQDEACGRLFRPGDVATLGRILSEYVEDVARRQTHGRAARQVAVERFSLSEMLRSYEATYDVLLRGNGPPGIADEKSRGATPSDFIAPNRNESR
jgi:sugar transferase (PEP-CTERM/EpsH1 system associated)